MKQTVQLAVKENRQDILEMLEQLNREGKLIEKETYFKYNKDEN
jgi:hypothetical protein